MTEYLLWLTLFFLVLPIAAFLIVKLGTYGYLMAQRKFEQRYEDKATKVINDFFNERVNRNGHET